MKTQIQYPSIYIVYDLETTGIDPHTAEITEISVMRVDGDQQHGKSWLVKTKNPIPKEASDITGITDELLKKDGVDFETIIPELLEMFDSLPIIGHNISAYDNVILKRYFKQAAADNAEVDHLMNSLAHIERCIDTAPMIKSMMMQYNPEWSIFAERMWYESTVEYNTRIMQARAWGIKWNLKASCEFLDIDVSDLVAHRAAADVVMTDRLYRSMTGLS